MDPLSKKVAARFVAASIHWIKSKGSLQQLTGTRTGIYAKSSDGRFLIWVTRWRAGQPGSRSYSYLFSATDYGIPSGTQRYSEVPLRDTERSDPQKAMAACERWLADNPLPPR